MITLGLSEPTAEQMNNCAEPLAQEICALKNGVPNRALRLEFLLLSDCTGVKMEMYNEDNKEIVEEEVFADLVCNNSNTPGAQKFSGLAGHSSDMNPCPLSGIGTNGGCTASRQTPNFRSALPLSIPSPQIALDDSKILAYLSPTNQSYQKLVTPQTLDYQAHSTAILSLCLPSGVILVISFPHKYKLGFKLREDGFNLKQKFYAKKEPHRVDEILARHGVQFSALDWILGWHPSKQTALDFMHCVFLGEDLLLWSSRIVVWLFTRILFNGHMFYGAGPHSGRQRFEDAVNSIKWPSHITRVPKNLGENQSLKKADEWRNLLTVTPVILWLSWRNLNNNNIPDTEPPVAPSEVIKAKHSRKRKSLYDIILMLCAGVQILSMRKISIHEARAGVAHISNYCRGLLLLGAELSINHHLAMHFLAMFKLFGPVYTWWLFAYKRFNDAHPKELAAVQQIINTKRNNQQGSMMTELRIFQSQASTELISLPRCIRKSPIDLHNITLEDAPPTMTVYSLLLEFYSDLWPELELRHQFSHAGGGGLSFVGDKVARSLSYIRKDGL
ncbi:hypothetical protein V5O48_017603 [Marasmius crinis-equi]|uniref:Uncharacterized protein n=1 Tax=Marasmius crinis-equi TaxID=585013 RepID=A0ABR3ENJ3_9AGAR